MSISDPFKLVETAITEYTATKLRPSYLTYALEQLPLSFLFQPDSQKVTLKDAEYCTLCSVVAQLLILERKLGMTNVQLTAEASYFCTLLNIQNERVCEGVIKPNVVRRSVCMAIVGWLFHVFRIFSSTWLTTPKTCLPAEFAVFCYRTRTVTVEVTTNGPSTYLQVPP